MTPVMEAGKALNSWLALVQALLATQQPSAEALVASLPGRQEIGGFFVLLHEIFRRCPDQSATPDYLRNCVHQWLSDADKVKWVAAWSGMAQYPGYKGPYV